jgi:hypothetical protein
VCDDLPGGARKAPLWATTASESPSTCGNGGGVAAGNGATVSAAVAHRQWLSQEQQINNPSTIRDLSVSGWHLMPGFFKWFSRFVSKGVRCFFIGSSRFF